MNNKIMLITYADSLGKNLTELESILNKYFSNAIGGMHILPFYYSSGDRGFSPISYETVDKKFGTWDDILKLGEKYDLMFDFMINHISRESIYFKDFVENKEASKYKNLFIRYKDFWENGEPTEEDVDLIYKRKPKAPFYEVEFLDGTKEKVWCTFSDEQIDLNIDSFLAKSFIKNSLEFLMEKGAKVIRLDAFAYVTKKPGTSCFFLEPDIWKILEECREIVETKDAMVLPEIHEHYSIHKKLESHGYYTYDFALPMIMLYTLYSKNNIRLIEWFDRCPRNQFTTLDTHDGIGVVDVEDLMSEEEIEFTKENLYKYGANIKRKYSTAQYKNLDVYQINCTYYSALGDDDKKYLLSRAIQFFAPGIPQVYYVGLLSGKNDIELVEETKEGRDINRHYYTMNEVDQEIEREVNIKLKELMEFRNSNKAFDGTFSYNNISLSEFELVWTNKEDIAKLIVNLDDYSYEII